MFLASDIVHRGLQTWSERGVAANSSASFFLRKVALQAFITIRLAVLVGRARVLGAILLAMVDVFSCLTWAARNTSGTKSFSYDLASCFLALMLLHLFLQDRT